MSELIERQAAIDAIVQCTNCGDEDTLREYVLKHSLDNGWTGGILEALDAVKDLPTAQPEREEGEWIPVTNGRGGHECNKCHEYAPSYQDGDEHLTKFCPYCGTKMKGSAEWNRLTLMH